MLLAGWCSGSPVFRHVLYGGDHRVRFSLQEGKMALQSYTEGFMSIQDDDDAVVAVDKKAGADHMLYIRSQTVKDVNPLKDVPVEEQGDLEQVEINYV